MLSMHMHMHMHMHMLCLHRTVHGHRAQRGAEVVELGGIVMARHLEACGYT